MSYKILSVGHSCLDIVHMVSSIPKPNEKVASSAVTIQIGGNAANVAAAICDLGSSADLCTVVGSEHHPFTRILLALLRERSVGTKHCKFNNDQSCPNSTIMVTLDGERSIINWQSDEIKSAISIPDSLAEYCLVTADAYRIPMVRSVFSAAKQANLPTMIDIDGTIDDVGLIPSADYIWFSQEAWNCHRIPLLDLQSRFNGIVGITNGALPVTWTGPDREIKYQHPPVISPINTLGAGDVFRARLALGVCLNESLDDSVAHACISACEHITGKQLSKVF